MMDRTPTQWFTPQISRTPWLTQAEARAPELSLGVSHGQHRTKLLEQLSAACQTYMNMNVNEVEDPRLKPDPNPI